MSFVLLFVKACGFTLHSWKFVSVFPSVLAAYLSSLYLSKFCQIFLQTVWFFVVLAFAMAITTDIASAYISCFRKLLGNSDGWKACFLSNAFVLLLGVSVLRSFKIFCLFYFFPFLKFQKQPPEVFYSKRCSQKLHKIHRKTHVPESLFQ